MPAPGDGTPLWKIPNCVKELARQSRRRLTCSLSRIADRGFQDEGPEEDTGRRGKKRRARRSRREEEKKYAVVRVCQLRMIVGWLSFTPPCVFFRAPYQAPFFIWRKSPTALSRSRRVTLFPRPAKSVVFAGEVSDAALLPDISSDTAGKKRGFWRLCLTQQQRRGDFPFLADQHVVGPARRTEIHSFEADPTFRECRA